MRPEEATAAIGPAETGAFTAEWLHKLLCETVLKGDAAVPSVSDPALAEMARVLTNWQKLVELEGAHRKSSQLREKLAAALRAIDEVLPPLRAELVEAAQLFEAHEHELWCKPHQANVRANVRESVQAIDVLARGVLLVGESPALLHPELRMPPQDRWEDFAQPLTDLSIKPSRQARRQVIASSLASS